MKGNQTLSQSQDPAAFTRETTGGSFDYDLLVEELSYWTYVSADRRASMSLKNYAASQINLLKSHLPETREFDQLKKSS